MANYLSSQKFDQEFSARLNEAAKKPLSPTERLEQKVSFIAGSVSSKNITKEQIRNTLNK